MKIINHKNETTFIPTNPKAIVVIIHGMKEHHNRYDEFAKFLANNGYVVRTFDLLGHGEYAQELGHLDKDNGWELLIKQVEDEMDVMKSKYPNLELYLIGHSMGSILARNVYNRNEEKIDKLVLMGTPPPTKMYISGMMLNKCLRMFKGINGYSPLFELLFFGVGTEIKYPSLSWISKDQDNVANYKQDPLCGFRFSLGYYKNVLTGVKEIVKSKYKALDPNKPIAIFVGEDDPIIKGKRGIRNTVKKLKDTGYLNVETKIYPTLRHELLFEKEHDIIQKDILNFLNTGNIN